jgi:3-oxoacyl-[acyl-carrier protein] reductase
MSAVAERFGGIHILVNNAGVGPPYLGNRIVDMPEAHFDIMLSVHVKGAFLCTKYAAPAMLAQNWGRIINIGSIHGISGGRPGLANYATAKAGLEGFTKAASLELAPFGITVNCVAPGFVKTEMLKVNPEMEAAMIRQTPVGRLAEPSDIACLAAYLASDGAGHITGVTVRADGGRAYYVFDT